MYLKSLALKGFKSFGDSTLVELERGINVIVGSNGSGKSNIVDAISWVLGAQTTRSLRLQKMDDVIFSGSKLKTAAKSARVTMVLDNSTRTLGIDSSEVSIARTLSRSGESSYALNGRDCRLVDVLELLGDAAIGRAQHTIVGQGNLDAILDSKPEDRRMVIEDASGIAKYRRRQERTARRLEVVESESARASELLDELRKRIRPLERQAQTAKRHVDLQDEISQLKSYVMGSQYKQYMRIVESSKGEVDKLEGEISFLTQNIDHLGLEVNAPEAQPNDTHENAMVEIFNAMSAFETKLRVFVTKLNERIQRIDERISSANLPSRIGEFQEMISHKQEELSFLSNQILELGPELDEVELIENEVNDRGTPPTLSELNSAMECEKSLISRQRALLNQSSQLGAKLSFLERERDSSDGRVEAANTRWNSGKFNIETFQTDVERLKTSLAEISSKYDNAKTLLEVAQTKTAATADKMVSVRDIRAQAAGALDSLRSRLELLHSKSKLSIAKGVSDPLGVIIELIDIEPGFESIVEAGLAPIGLSIALGDFDQAVSTFQIIKRDTGAANIVVAKDIGPYQGADIMESPLAKVSSFVRSCDASITDIVQFALANALFFDGEVHELGAHWPSDLNTRVITRSCDIVTSFGIEFRTDVSVVTKSSLDEAQRVLETSTVAQSNVETEHSRITSQRDLLAQEVSGLADEMTFARFKLKELSRELELAQAEVAMSQNTIFESSNKRDEISLELIEIRTNCHLTDTELAQVDQELADLVQWLTDSRREIADLESARNSIRQRRSSLELVSVRLHERYKHCLSTIEQAQSQLQRETDAVGERARLVESLLVSKSTFEESYHGHNAALEQVCALKSAMDARIQRAISDRGDRLAQLGAKRKKLEQEIYERNRKQEALLQTREASRDSAIRAEIMVERIWRELELDPQIVMQIPLLPGVLETEAEAHLNALTKELASLGPINHLAASELREITARQSFLVTQLDDINTSVNELKTVSREINQEMQKVFLSAFDDVNVHFSSFFALLFPGGIGKLVLSSPDRPLDAGVDFELTIPGKNLRRLGLLSGGERSLVALAFLFAIFRSRPSPFYVLDEVEAALDDANLSKLLTLLCEFGSHAQVLIISHQKRTMEIANTLVGVSTTSEGVSKVISENLSSRGLPISEPIGATSAVS